MFLRLPQLPSVGANAASNWATGRVGRGWAGHSVQLPERGRSVRSLKTPVVGWLRERPPPGVRGVEEAPQQLGEYH